MKALKHKQLYIFALISMLIMFLPQQDRAILTLHIESVLQGEYWRFFSSHFSHYSWAHCLSNIIGLFLLIGIFNKSKQNMHWIIAATVISAAISCGLIFYSNKLDWYLGFSGVLTGLYAYASIKTFNENAIISITILTILLTYVATQLLEGELIDSIITVDLNASSYAHAFGLIAGIFYGIIEQYLVARYLSNDEYNKL